jgi:hypothetical protein
MTKRSYQTVRFGNKDAARGEKEDKTQNKRKSTGI